MPEGNSDLEFFDAALKFLENGESPPEGTSMDSGSRFKFQTAIWRHIYLKSKDAHELAESNRKQIRIQWILILLCLVLLSWHIGIPILGVVP